MRLNSNKDIDYAFNPVPVSTLDEGQKHRAMKVQKRVQEMAEEILDLVPECPDRTHAFRQLLDVKFWCVQAITHEKGVVPNEKATVGQTSESVQTKGPQSAPFQGAPPPN